MKDYFMAIIKEQIDRGLFLKKMIPKPLKYSELSGLSVRCNHIIDTNIESLTYILKMFDHQYNENIRFILRELRRCIRDLELVEYYGVMPLYYQSDEMKYLNKLVFGIVQEINYPLDHPAVACISTEYYFFNTFTNVIFIPFGESEFLLHIPDIFHELGHGVLMSKESDPKLCNISKRYDSILNKITEHYKGIMSRKKRETGPKEIIYLIKLIQDNWKSYWIDEFLCDLFALVTLGPAYVFSHLHLSTKKSKNVYQFSDILPQTHPSDDSRMKMLLYGLELLGFEKKAKEIFIKWNSMPYVTSIQPPVEYQYAYPEKLMKEIAAIFMESLKENSIHIITSSTLGNLDDRSIRKLLNKAWDKFWKDPQRFREWETDIISKLKKGHYFKS